MISEPWRVFFHRPCLSPIQEWVISAPVQTPVIANGNREDAASWPAYGERIRATLICPDEEVADSPSISPITSCPGFHTVRSVPGQWLHPLAVCLVP
jgi:hypothetical protein